MNRFRSLFNGKSKERTATKNKIVLFFSMMLQKIADFFMHYENYEELLMNSSTSHGMTYVHGKLSRFGNVKRVISRSVEKSGINKAVDLLSDTLLGTSLRNYGVTVFIFGAFVTIASAFKYVGGFAAFNELLDTFILGGSILIISALMFLSHRNLGYLLCESRLFSFFLFDLLCFDKKGFSEKEHKHTNGFISVFFGIVSGVLSIFVSPLDIIGFVLMVLAFITVIKNPENGIILTFLLIPFLSEPLLFSLVLLSCISVFSKVARNKRVLRFGLLDTAVLFFALVVFMCGLLAPNGAGNMQATMKILLFLLLGWFLSNTIKTTELTVKCIKALSVSVTLVSLFGIILFFFDTYNLDNRNMFFRYMYDIVDRFPFDDIASYAGFAVILLPFSLSSYRRGNIGSGIAMTFSFVFAAFSMNVAVWTACIAMAVIYFGFMKPKVFLWFGVVAAFFSVLFVVFPGIFSAVIGFVNEFSDMETVQAGLKNANTCSWKAAGEFLFSGFGSGKDLNEHVFKCLFGGIGIDYVEYVPFIMRVLLHYGIVGVIVLALVYYTFLSNCLSLYYVDRFCKPSLKNYIVSCVASVSSLLFTGLFFPLPGSERSVLYLILLMYISVSIRKSSKTEYVPAPYELSGEQI